MKNTLSILALFFLSLFVFAEEKEVVVKTQLKNVTVYLSGAELTREAEVNLEQGRTVLKFLQLSSKINPASITASLSGNAKIISILHQLDYLTDLKQNNRIKILQDSVEDLSYNLQKIQMEKSALMEEQKILTDNRARLGKEEGVLTTELMAATNFYRSKLNEINSKLINLSVSEKKLRNLMERLELQLNELNAVQNKPSSEITITVDSKTPVRTKVSLKYLVGESSWAPKYDLRTKGAGSPIELDYRAEVYNNSDEEWPNVKLVLSTGDPTKTMERPTLEPWGLSYNQGYQQKSQSLNQGYLNNYSMDGEGRLNTYQPKPDLNNTDNARRRVEVSYSEIDVSELSVDFSIKEPYSIPSDGKVYIVDVNEYKLDAVYNYYAVPKVDKDAFLIGKIVGWESLNLIEGPANVYFNGTYIGQTNLDTRYSNDSLELSLGRDRKVIITRVKKQDYNSKKLIGINRSESFTYDIDIRNTNADSIFIEIVDQVPIAQESDIEVSINEISKAQHEVTSGKLIWKFNLAPSESKKLTISYTVKYPKNKELVLRKTRKVASPKFRY
jgi:uncharacterized protein (TIGR02231 family)